MALAVLTSISNVSADLLTADLVDNTVYGTPNADRDDLAAYLYLYKRNAQQEDTAVIIDNTSPLTATRWSFSLAGDGWYRAILFLFPVWTAGAYVADNCVYHSGSYYKANTSTTETPGAGSEWDLITDILNEVLDLSGSNVTVGQTNNFTTPNAEAGILGNNLQDLGPSIKSGKCKDVNAATTVLFGEALYDSAWNNFARGDNVEAQEIIDFINNQWAA